MSRRRRWWRRMRLARRAAAVTTVTLGRMRRPAARSLSLSQLTLWRRSLCTPLPMPRWPRPRPRHRAAAENRVALRTWQISWRIRQISWEGCRTTKSLSLSLWIWALRTWNSSLASSESGIIPDWLTQACSRDVQPSCPYSVHAL